MVEKRPFAVWIGCGGETAVCCVSCCGGKRSFAVRVVVVGKRPFAVRVVVVGNGRLLCEYNELRKEQIFVSGIKNLR